MAVPAAAGAPIRTLTRLSVHLWTNTLGHPKCGYPSDVYSIRVNIYLYYQELLEFLKQVVKWARRASVQDVVLWGFSRGAFWASKLLRELPGQPQETSNRANRGTPQVRT